MPYIVVKGKYSLFYRSPRIVGSRPRGDSIWFEPQDPDQLLKVGGRRVRYGKGGYTTLRLEGIDALELAYAGSHHQKMEEAVAARGRLLHVIGFEDIRFAQARPGEIESVVRGGYPREIDGYILTNGVDPEGHPIAFAFLGVPPHSDGSDTGWLSLDLMAESLNAQLLAGGYVYPVYYTGLPTDLRNKLTDLVNGARNCASGIWNVDLSSSGAQVRSPGDLDKYALWPKLYRRLVAFFAQGNTDISHFDSWMRRDARRDDQLWIVSRGEPGYLHGVCDLRDKSIRLKFRPEDLVILPR